ncbi:hypothetical protein AeRB84_009329 [Aphanomyces euteiches]|nr:hypothetical protein AeRB84_009329 [Aphanomyces euteiches]
MGLTAALIGPFIERRGPRLSMAIATVLVVLGWISAYCGIMFQVYPLLYIGTGVLVAAGYGITIVVSISIVQKWFPDLRGVSGITVAGMGGGENIFKQVSQDLDDDGLRQVFLLHGGLALAFKLMATMVLRTPPPNYAVNGSDIHCIPLNKAPAAAHVQNNYLDVVVNYEVVGQNQSLTTDGIYFTHVKALSLVQCIFSPDFLFLYLAFAVSASPIVLFLSEMPAYVVIMLRATIDQTNYFVLHTNIACALGNVLGPILADAIIRIFYGNPAFVRKMVFMAFLLTQTISVAVLIQHIDNIDTFQWPLYIAASSSGVGFGIIPSLLSDLFGVYNAGTMFGLILTSWCAASVTIRVLLRESSSMALEIPSHLQVLLVISIVGCVMVGLARSSSMDRFYRGYQLTICGKVLIQRPSSRLMQELSSIKMSQDGPSDMLHEWISDEYTADYASDSTSPILLVHPDYHHMHVSTPRTTELLAWNRKIL